jgi:hypothetical protein
MVAFLVSQLSGWTRHIADASAIQPLCGSVRREGIGGTVPRLNAIFDDFSGIGFLGSPPSRELPRLAIPTTALGTFWFLYAAETIYPAV